MDMTLSLKSRKNESKKRKTREKNLNTSRVIVDKSVKRGQTKDDKKKY